MSNKFSFPLTEYEDLLSELQISLKDAAIALNENSDLQLCIQVAGGDVTKIRKCLKERLPKATRCLNDSLRDKRLSRESNGSL